MKILLLEDEALVRRAFARALKIRGHEVIEAEDPVQAQQMLDCGLAPDLIISDWDMPQMTGGEFCVLLRARRIHTPLYIVSGRVEIHRIAAGVGANGVYVKPLSTDDLNYILDLHK